MNNLTTIEELVQFNIDFLNGIEPQCPSHLGPTDPETKVMLHDLLMLHIKHRIITYCSQPAESIMNDRHLDEYIHTTKRSYLIFLIPKNLFPKLEKGMLRDDTVYYTVNCMTGLKLVSKSNFKEPWLPLTYESSTEKPLDEKMVTPNTPNATVYTVAHNHTGYSNDYLCYLGNENLKKELAKNYINVMVFNKSFDDLINVPNKIIKFLE
jgi:hypothetical protein